MHEKDLQLKYTETSRTKQAESFYGSILSSNGIPVNLTVINPERRLMGKVCNEMPPFHSPLLLLIQVFSCILPNHVTTRTALCSDVFNCHFAWKNVEELRRRVWVSELLNYHSEAIVWIALSWSIQHWPWVFALVVNTQLYNAVDSSIAAYIVMYWV